MFGDATKTKEAKAWLRDEISFDDSPTVAPNQPVAPTYADNRVSLDEAFEPLRDVFGGGFKDAILTSRAARTAQAAFDALDANDPARRKKLRPYHDPLVEIIPTETGIGKTYIARKGLTPLAKLGFKFVYAVPRHDLADEIAAAFRAEGLRKEQVEVYRAYDRPDPRAPKKHKMCRRPDEFKTVRALGINTHTAICERKPDLVPIRCTHASRCGLMRQREATPNIWIVPTSLLFTAKPVFFPEIDAVVIDEGFIDNVFGDPFKIDVQVLRDTPIEKDLYNPEDYNKLTLFRHRLREAIKENGGGPLSRAALLAQEIDSETAWWLGRLEHRPLDSAELSPDMTDREVKSAANKFRAKATQARNACTMWDEISTFLGEDWAEEFYGDRSLSGRLTVKEVFCR